MTSDVGARAGFRHIGRADGLPSNQVHALAQDDYGRVWLAGPAGLAMFDGVRTFQFGRNQGLSTQGLRSVAWGEGALWIGSDIGVDRRVSGRPVASVPLPHDHGFVQAIATDGNGAVWFGAARGLSRRSNDGHTMAITDPLLRDKFVTDLMVDGSDRVYALVEGVVVAGGGPWERLAIQGIGGPVTAMCAGRHSQIFAGTGAVVELDRDHAWVSRFSLPRGETARHLLLTDDDLWVATKRKLLRYGRHGSRWRLIETVLDDITVNDLLRARDSGDLIVATDTAGIIVVSALRETISLRGPLGHGAVLSLAADGTGVHVGGDGISWYDDGSDSAVHEGLQGLRVWDLRRGSDGSLWAATESGLRVRDETDGSWRPAHHQVPMLAGPTRCLLRRADDTLVGTVTGLAKVDDPGHAEVVFDAAAPGYVYTLEERGDGTVLIGTIGHGMWVWETGRAPVQLHPEVLGERSNVYAIAVRPDGVIAVSADDAVAIIDGPRCRAVHRGTAAVAGWALRWGEDDQLWLGGSGGLQELDASTGEVRRTISSQLDEDGWEFTTSRSLLVRDELVWCGVAAGCVMVDPVELAARVRPPEARIGWISWRGIDIDPRARTVTVPADGWSAWVYLASPSHLDAQVTFQYNVIGQGTGWVTAASDGIIRLTAPAPGQYEVHIRAVSPAAGTGPESVGLRIDVASPWWAPQWLTAPARLLKRVAAVSGAEGRNRDLLRENRELEMRVRTRTRELVAANERLATVNERLHEMTITDPLTGVFNRRWLDTELPRAVSRAHRTSEPLALLVIDVDHFKSYNDRYGHHVGDTCLRLLASTISGALRTDVDAVVRHGGEEFAVLLPDCGSSDAKATAERVRLAVDAVAVPHGGTGGTVTISVGGALLAPPSLEAGAERAEDLLERADAALYRAKEAGRNRTAWSSTPSPLPDGDASAASRSPG